MNFKNISILLFAFFSFIHLSFTSEKKQNYTTIKDFSEIEIPKNVKEILDAKCMGCHSNDTKGGKSKMKLNFDKFTNGEYSSGKIISKLIKLDKILSADKMPPKKFLSKFPDKKLTKEESILILEWANSQKEILTSD